MADFLPQHAVVLYTLVIDATTPGLGVGSGLQLQANIFGSGDRSVLPHLVSRIKE